MLVVNDEWRLSDVSRSSYSWVGDWNNDIQKAFAEHIAILLPWQQKDDVLFFWQQSCAVMAPWWLVCKYWICFMYEDEMNIIINPNSQMALIVGVNGYVATVKIA